MRRAFVTGASGFVGSHLLSHLNLSGWDVTAYDLHAGAQTDIPFYQGNLCEDPSLPRALQESQPDVIFHLAGQLKSDRPDDFYKAHVLGTLSLLEAAVSCGSRPRIIVASSSAVYGPGPGAQPIDETFAPMPVTHYAVSKLAQESLALRYHNVSALDVVCVRTFNLLGPGLSPNMAPSAFARQVAQAEMRNGTSQIRTGDLSAQRDYVDVRDAVRAYSMIAEHGATGEVYNVCSGQPVAMSEILQLLLDQSRVPVESVVDPARVQKNDVPIQIGSAQKLKQSTGWDLEFPVQQSLVDLLDDWRKKIKLES